MKKIETLTKAQQAAFKAWNTRRSNAKALASKRSGAAKKAWRTRRAHTN